jgi:uncharacterized OB-fold protein
VTESRPVAPGLFTWPAAEPRLIASRCADCGAVAFPAAADCAGCGGLKSAELLLPDRGALWTFTTQNFRPPSPPYAGRDTAETFRPYTVGYVQLSGEILVESRLTEPDPEQLAIGREMRLVVVPFGEDPDGTPVVTFAFAPVSVGEEN